MILHDQITTLNAFISSLSDFTFVKDKLALLCISKFTTVSEHDETIYKDTQSILEYIAINDNLTEVLNKIVHLSEKRNINTKSSILLLDENKQQLLVKSAPNLPDYYTNVIDGIAVSENMGSCSSAVYKQKRVITENIDIHTNWLLLLDLTRKANLHACWSEPIFSSTNEILGSFAIYHDIQRKPNDFELKLMNSYAYLASIAIEKERKKLNFQKRNNELERILHNASVGLMHTTQERIILRANEHLSNMFGYDNPDDMIGIDINQFHLSRDGLKELRRRNYLPLKNKSHINTEYLLRKKDGSPIWCGISGKALDENTPADLNKGILWTITDISKRKKIEKKSQERINEIKYKNSQLKTLASKDYLTGLYNRSKLDEILMFYIKRSKRHNCNFGLILLDIDFFKNVNDTYGHQVGDKILREFSNLLIKSSRETDRVGRWGGEEFSIIVEDADKLNIMKFSEKLRKNIQNYNFSIVCNITVSLGVTLYQMDDDLNSMMKRVDNALYSSKHNGRNMVSFL